MCIPDRLENRVPTIHSIFLIMLAFCAAGFFAACRSGDPPPSAKEDDGGRTIEESYGFSLDASGELVFTAVEEDSGYKAESSDVTISNTGSVGTGLVQIALSGDDMDKFTLSPTSIDDIAVSGSETFTVSTTTELPAGEYTASVAVTGADGFSKSFDIRFNVYVPEIIPVEFTAISADGAAQTATTTAISFTLDTEIDITEDNISLNGGGTGAVKGILSSSGAGTWSLTVSGITSEGEVTVNLTKDRHTFSGTNTVAVHYQYTYGLRIVSGATLEFPEAINGYTTAPEGKVVTVENTGNQPLSGVAVTVGPRYEATPASTGIDAGASASFTIKPKANLATGTYNESLQVGTSTTHAEVTAKFTVRNGKVSADPITNGTMTLSHTTAAPNTTITVTIAPNANYALKPSSLALTPTTAVTFNRVTAVQYTFPMPGGKDVKVGAQLIKPVDNKMATGGTITIVPSGTGMFDEVHEFNTVGTATLTVTRAPEAGKTRVLVVGGGGGGGGASYPGGGGGAGGYIEKNNYTLAAGNTSVAVGAGGAGGTFTSGTTAVGTNGTNGGDSKFGTFTAYGGGGGAKRTSNSDNVAGSKGGSSGGSGGNVASPDPTKGTGAAANEMFGNKGGSGGNGGNVGNYVSGGGGAGGPGTYTEALQGTDQTRGKGPGKTSTIASIVFPAASATYAEGGPLPWIATTDHTSPVPVTYGSGGVGGWNTIGGAGKSGIVVVRFPWVAPN